MASCGASYLMGGVSGCANGTLLEKILSASREVFSPHCLWWASHSTWSVSLGVLLATPGRTVVEYREACELFLLNATEANECGQESAYNLGVTLCDDDSPAAIRDTTEAAKMFELAASLATADEGEDLDFGAKAKFWHARLLFTGQMGHAPAGSDQQRRQMH